jgi:glycosyltransferase involved in cell wall biosynthesis
LISALKHLQSQADFRLTLVGPGSDYVRQLERTAPPEFWQRVTICDYLPSHEVAGAISRATMMVFPTRADTSPNSVKEAAVAGLPVVASRIGGIVDYVLPGRNGLLFEPGNLAALEKSLLEAWKHPLFSRGEVEPATLSRLREQLSPRVMAEKFRETYARVQASACDSRKPKF